MVSGYHLRSRKWQVNMTHLALPKTPTICAFVGHESNSLSQREGIATFGSAQPSASVLTTPLILANVSPAVCQWMLVSRHWSTDEVRWSCRQLSALGWVDQEGAQDEKVKSALGFPPPGVSKAAPRCEALGPPRRYAQRRSSTPTRPVSQSSGHSRVRHIASPAWLGGCAIVTGWCAACVRDSSYFTSSSCCSHPFFFALRSIVYRPTKKMAAADYYASTPSGRRPSASYLAPPPMTQSYSYSHPTPPLNGSPQFYPQSLPPPAPQAPLDQHKPSVHFSQSPPLPPQQQRYSFSSGQRPSLPQYQSSPPPPSNANAAVPYPSYPPPNFSSQQFLAPPPPDAMSSGYTSDPEHHRRKHKHHRDRERSRDRHNSTGSSRSIQADGLIGAAGGGLIGDMIMPGLGTVGGVLVGWFGGKDYGHHRKSREDKRSRDQDDWEKKWGPSNRSRSHEPHVHGRRPSHG